jgi:hypothetical protein
MFNYECYKQKGTVLGTCIDGFLFGACCRLPTPDDIVSSTSAATTTTEVVVVVDNFIVSSSSSRPAENEDGLTNYIKFGPLKTNAGPEGTSQDVPQQQAESSSELAGENLRNCSELVFLKLLRSPGIDSKKSIPSAYVAWRAGTTALFLLGS